MKYKIIFALVFLFLFSCSSSSESDSSKSTNSTNKTYSKATKIKNTEGQQLFRVKCAACHAPDRKIIGPPLAGALKSWNNNKQDLYTYVRNPSDARDKGIKRAIEIEDYDPSVMNPFPELSDKQLDQIFAFIEEKATSK